jgi:ubiquinone/menaquinone biosynthesis C-methylase UbiE
VDRENVDVFNRDAATNAGYGYTTGERLSSRMATKRSIEMVTGTAEFAGRLVLDLGCGDGFYTARIWDIGRPQRLVALDAAEAAVRVAATKLGERPVRFLTADGHRLPFRDDSFDVVLLQSILHHDDTPEDMVKEALRVASRMVVHEPNGNNLGLKIIERVSKYHIEHGEKSYPPRRVSRWIAAAGGTEVSRRFAGFVPMFCPDVLARLMKFLEPLVERLPLVNALGCAVYVMVVKKNGRS